MADTTIASRPPNDGREWDCQCARCGSSTGRQDCGWCGGEGWVEDYDDPDDGCQRCSECKGKGGWWSCLSGADWCEAHPMKGRELVPRGEVEWFVVEVSRG